MREGIFAYISPVDRCWSGWVKEQIQIDRRVCGVVPYVRGSINVGVFLPGQDLLWCCVPVENVHIVPDELLDVAKQEAAASGLSEEEGMKTLEQYMREVVEGKDDE